MNNCKRKLLIIGVIIIAFLTPLFVNLAFKSVAPFPIAEAKWSPDGLLTYIGSLFAATATIIAVVLTINNNYKQQEQDTIKKAKPWLVSDTDILSSSEEVLALQNGHTLFVFQYKGAFSTSTVAPSIIGKDYQVNETICIVKYTLDNVGGDTAIQVKMTIDEFPFIPDFALGKDHKKEFVFILPKKEEKMISDYKIQYEYGDIVSNTLYLQTEHLKVKPDTLGLCFSQSKDDLITRPIVKENT